MHLECDLSSIRKLSQSFELSVFELSFDLVASGEDVGFPLAQTMDSDKDQSHAEDFDKFLAHMTNDLCDQDEGKGYDVSKCKNPKPNNIWFDNIMSKERGTIGLKMLLQCSIVIMSTMLRSVMSLVRIWLQQHARDARLCLIMVVIPSVMNFFGTELLAYLGVLGTDTGHCIQIRVFLTVL